MMFSFANAASFFVYALLVVVGTRVHAEVVFSGPTDTTHAIDPGIAATDARFQEWASYIDPARTRFAPRGSTAINQTGGFNSLGDLDATQIANGESPGFLTVGFRTGIRNGVGHDFAVFENGFTFGANPDGVPGLFAEFAYVDVSSNGTDFARFPSISRNSAPLPGGIGSAFAGYDVTQVHNLAGKHASGYGTPFDLEDLVMDPLVVGGLLDLENIQYVRLVDIPGSGDFLDSEGNPILDNWLTTGGAGGFDFRLGEGMGVGVINATAVPEPGSLGLLSFAGLAALVARRRHRRKACGDRSNTA